MKKNNKFKTKVSASFKKINAKQPHWFVDGVASPLEIVIINGQSYVSGSTCEPHNCGDANVKFLYNQQTNRLIAHYKSYGSFETPNLNINTDMGDDALHQMNK